MCVSGNASENLRYIGTHIFFNYFFLGNKILLCILKGIWKNIYNFMHFERHKMHKIIFFSRKP